ncbi:MAG: ABC transporter transmembrane domain-containing protein, partial [Lentisphaeria bacterium]
MKRLLKYALRYKWRLLFGLISGLAVGGSMFGLLNSLGSVFDSGQSAVDVVASNGNMLDQTLAKFGFEKTNPDGSLTFAFTLITILAFPFYIGLKGFFTYTNRYFMRWVGGRVVNDLRNDLFKNVSNQSLSFYSKSEVGTLVSRIMNDSGMVEKMISSSISDLTRCPMEIMAVFSFIIYQALVLKMHSITITLLILIPLCFIPFVLISRKIKKYANRSLARISELTKQMLETFTGIRVVKAYHMEQAEVERFIKTNSSYFRQVMSGLRAELLISPVMEFAGVCGMVGFLAYAYSTGLKFDQIAPFGVAAMFLYQPLKTI